MYLIGLLFVFIAGGCAGFILFAILHATRDEYPDEICPGCPLIERNEP